MLLLHKIISGNIDTTLWIYGCYFSFFLLIVYELDKKDQVFCRDSSLWWINYMILTIEIPRVCKHKISIQVTSVILTLLVVSFRQRVCIFIVKIYVLYKFSELHGITSAVCTYMFLYPSCSPRYINHIYIYVYMFI